MSERASMREDETSVMLLLGKLGQCCSGSVKMCSTEKTEYEWNSVNENEAQWGSVEKLVTIPGQGEELL